MFHINAWTTFFRRGTKFEYCTEWWKLHPGALKQCIIWDHLLTKLIHQYIMLHMLYSIAWILQYITMHMLCRSQWQFLQSSMMLRCIVHMLPTNQTALYSFACWGCSRVACISLEKNRQREIVHNNMWRFSIYVRISVVQILCKK